MSNGDGEERAGKMARLIQPTTFDQAFEMATKLAQSDLVPKAYRGKPANVVIAWEMGAEVGLSPMTALQSIAVIGGKPVMYGEAPLGVVMASGHLEEIVEEDDGEVATCTVKRRGWPKPVTRTFSMQEAKQAKLFERDEQGNGKWVILADRWAWQSWPRDMRKYRARGRALKDVFADVLKGLAIGEEVRDMGDLAAPSAPVGDVIETERVAPNIYMPREKPQESAEASKSDTQAGVPESGIVAQPLLPEAQNKPKEMKNEEVKAEATPPEPKPKVMPPGFDFNTARNVWPEVEPRAVSALDADHSAVTASTPILPADESEAFTIGKTAWRTRGMTEGQVMESFRLEAALRNRKLFARFRPALVKAIGLPADHPDIHRKNLTKEQAELFIASLYDIMPDLKGAKIDTVTL